ncbi:hypothetical protein [Mesorhizobium sp. RMAD-H1]|uniref:hypothetical protein n=1 Tax=Mesorhizobium sp. RMAD-H1 TaxID=2587065 RepID=UPI00160ED1E7|nr:hypothetical protein [Mesorhizobium sp. RMAD-H1]MBB2973222.1 hypothetical protein [Mesorhizobium sp. RMAD-H1]
MDAASSGRPTIFSTGNAFDRQEWDRERKAVSERMDRSWLERLPACNMVQYRRRIAKGGRPLFVLDQSSTFANPVWLLLLEERNGTLLRVTTPTNPLARRLSSINQVYSIARSSGIRSLTVPVEQKR